MLINSFSMAFQFHVYQYIWYNHMFEEFPKTIKQMYNYFIIEGLNHLV